MTTAVDTPDALFDTDDFRLRFVRLFRERVNINVNVPLAVARQARFQYDLDHIAETMVIWLETFMLRGSAQRETGSYVVPASWWDQFKLEKFPARLLARFPPKFKTQFYTYEKHIHVCPHADVEWPDHRHIEFMEMRRTVEYPSSSSRKL